MLPPGRTLRPVRAPWRDRSAATRNLPLVSFLRRRPALLAVLGYTLVGVLVLFRSIRPGRTLVPADLLNGLAPYRAILGTARAHNGILSDPASVFFPWVKFLGHSLRQGAFPQWNPYLLGGVPVSPNGFFSTYYPLFWISRWLSPFDTYNVFVALHLILAATGVYAFARVLGCRVASSWIVGLLALTSDFWVHWSLHLVHLVAFAWLPWVLAAAHLAVTRPSRLTAAGLALVFGLLWLGGNPQYAYFGTLAVAGYAGALLLRRWLAERRLPLNSALALGAGLALGAALAAPSLLPELARGDSILRTHEPVSAMDHTQVPRGEAIRALVPDATGNPADGVDYAPNPELEMDSPFIGVSAVLLGAAALAARRERWLLVLGVAGVLLLAFVGWPNHLLYDVVPGYDRFRIGARWLAVLPAFGLPLAAVGLDAVIDGERRARMALAVAGAAAVVLVTGWYLHQRGLAGAPHTYLSHRVLWAVGIVVVVVAAALLARRLPRAAILVVLACVLAEVFFHTPRWFPRIVERHAYPKVAVAEIARARQGRVIRVQPGPRNGFSPFHPDLPMLYGADDSSGWISFFPRAADRYLRLIDDYGTFAKDNTVAPPLSDPAKLRSPLVDALDVRTVISETAIDQPDLTLLTRAPLVYAKASSGAAAVVRHAEPTSEAGMWKKIGEPGWVPAQTAFVVGLPAAVDGSGGSVTGRRPSTDEERWDVVAEKGGFLFVSAAYDSGWHATVDGRTVPVRRANGLFRGVTVPPGHHDVRFLYRNAAQIRGLRVGALALVVVAGVAISVPWRKLARQRRVSAFHPPSA